jgi:hypothetical protein
MLMKLSKINVSEECLSRVHGMERWTHVAPASSKQTVLLAPSPDQVTHETNAQVASMGDNMAVYLTDVGRRSVLFWDALR